MVTFHQGLGKFKEQLKKGSAERNLGSIPWTAPEILGEEPDVQYEMSDVYSFGNVAKIISYLSPQLIKLSLGIILLELLTRQAPYEGIR